MPQPRRRVTRSEKREQAYHLFSRGFTNADVCRQVGISKDTATAWRRKYEEQLRQEAADNPRLLTDILASTGRNLAELEEIRRTAWDEIRKANQVLPVVCDACGEVTDVVVGSPTVRNQLLNTALKAQEVRAKMFGVMGVKAEFLAQVAQVQAVQTKLLEFMSRELCPADRRKLDEYMGTPAMAELMGGVPLDADAWEDGEEESHLPAAG